MLCCLTFLFISTWKISKQIPVKSDLMQNCSCRAYYITVTLEASHGRNCQNLIFSFFLTLLRKKMEYNTISESTNTTGVTIIKYMILQKIKSWILKPIVQQKCRYLLLFSFKHDCLFFKKCSVQCTHWSWNSNMQIRTTALGIMFNF